MIDKNCRIVGSKNLAEDIFRLDIHSPHIAGESEPGQFVMINPAEGVDPLLRRPFSVHDTDREEKFSLLIEVRGEGTKLLVKKQKGEYAKVLGPLGEGFELCDLKGSLYVVAGGVGFAPMKFALQRARENGIDTRVFYGAERRSKLIEVEKYDADITFATEDGSRGCKALITAVFEDYLEQNPELKGTVITCGPEEMMKEVNRLCVKYSLDIQISYEEKMACGFGLCLGCTCETTDGYKKSCQDGPVFDGKKIRWR